ncbi:UDP-N-acetylmuramoyl-L-alanine--D-glutamate ligase [Pseudofrankia asymbiotica]|nr:UDP-N-acetylmuramoyl-L-alanine--D-glutamate ligase [Pseudofrankia asymbiotica]
MSKSYSAPSDGTLYPTPTRPRLRWSDLSGRRVGIWGFGTEGRASVARLQAMGTTPAVIVDDRDVEGGGVPVMSFDRGGLEALADCDVIIKTPGVTRYSTRFRTLADKGIPIVGGLALWLEERDLSQVVCVTGTKGKSTTSAIVGHMLRGLGKSPFVGGNIGLPPWDPNVDHERHDCWIIETSSYQATDVSVSPPVVAVTSLSQDHIDWHGGSPENYYRDKLSVCRQPGADLTVANGDDKLIRDRSGLLGPRVLWVSSAEASPSWIRSIKLPGSHNQMNVLIAAACVRAMGVAGADRDEALQDALRGFEGLESRLNLIGEAGGVTFVDDSLSTNVLPTLAALDSFPGRRIALIVGGYDRQIDYAPLGVALRDRKHPTAVHTLPDSGPRIRAAIEAVDGTPPVTDHDDLRSAVRAAFAWASPDGIVLLSPAAPSFGHFADYRDRSAAFRRAFDECARG